MRCMHLCIWLGMYMFYVEMPMEEYMYCEIIVFIERRKKENYAWGKNVSILVFPHNLFIIRNGTLYYPMDKKGVPLFHNSGSFDP